MNPVAWPEGRQRSQVATVAFVLARKLITKHRLTTSTSVAIDFDGVKLGDRLKKHSLINFGCLYIEKAVL